jgi:hypothetical protein
MRRKSGIWFAVLFMMMLAVMSGGCGGSSDGGGAGPDDKTLLVLGTLPDDALSSAVQESLEDTLTAKVVLVHDDYVNSLTDEEEVSLKDAFGSGAAVVLVEPTWDNLKAVSDLTGAHLSVAAGTSQAAEPLADIYVFLDSDTGYHTYVLSTAPGTLSAPETPATVISSDESGDYIVSEDVTAVTPPPTAGQDRELTKDEYRERLGHLVSWLNGGGAKPRVQRTAFSIAAAGDNIQDIVKAQTITFNCTAQSMWALEDENDNPTFRPSTTFTNTYFIYAVYSKDQDYDYYILDEESDIVNGPMWKGLWTNKYWGSYTHFSGYFMSAYYNDHYLRNSANSDLTADRFDLIQPTPTTSTGSSSYSVNQSYSISGSIGFNGMGGTGSISGGATYGSSHTMNINDVTVNYQGGQPESGINAVKNAKWRYVVGNLPTAQNKYTVYYPHDSTISDPPAIAVNTATFYSSWIWRVKSPQPNETFTVYCRYQANYGFTKCRASWPKFEYVNNDNAGYLQEGHITLLPPPRS